MSADEWVCRTCGVGTPSDAPDDTRPAGQRVGEHVARRGGWHSVTIITNLRGSVRHHDSGETAT